MNSLTLTAIVFAIVFAGGAIGLELQHALPESYTTGGPRDFVGAVVGLVTLLVALVLGLLIWTAYGVFSTQRASVQTMALNVLRFDEALQDYGPDAEEGRGILRSQLKGTIEQIWGVGNDSSSVIRNFSAAVSDLKYRQAFFELVSAGDGPRESGKGGCVSSVDRDRPDTHTDGAVLGRSYLLFAPWRRRRLGDVPLLRLWRFIETPRGVVHRARARRDGRRVVDLRHRRFD